ncbi:MAG TPA: nitrate- and nitrite sensing domain-containing protein [Baekduia sp.]|nr:nitrate- and nitrite sensing domain-containing protein [Baekduia sp.]
MALLPVGCLLAFVALSGINQWRDANRLREFRAATRLSFATANVADALGRERLATVLADVQRGPSATARLRAAERTTTLGLRAATRRAAGVSGPVDVAGRLDAGRRQREALLLEARSGALDQPRIAQGYGVIVHDLLDIVRDLDAGRPSRASGRAADAYVAILQAIEAASRERADLAAMLAPRGPRLPPMPSRWEAVEATELDAFRQNAGGGLVSDLEVALFSPAGTAVQRLRDRLTADPAATVRQRSLPAWVSASGRRIAALRAIERETARSLAAAAAHDLDRARTRAVRDLVLSLAVLLVVATLALALRRSITRPLQQVSEGARMLSSGDLTFDVTYAGHDEIGDVAAAFRDLHVTAERLAAEIRAMNAAIRENRLDHRADLSAFQGTWSQLLGGMNDTVAAFAELHGRRLRAEREAERIFAFSLELLAVAGLDGYFKRVNPAFERTLGFTSDVILSRPFADLIHPDDRERTQQAMAALARGDEVVQFENRFQHSDGSYRWLQWSSRAVPEEGVIYAAARDITQSRRAAGEQAALRRVATLVAQGVAPTEVFRAVAWEVQRLLETRSAEVLRYEADGSMTVLGAVHAEGGAPDVTATRSVARSRLGTRTDRLVGAPIIVEDEVWGAIVASAAAPGQLPADTEARLASFTELVATAIANANSRAELAASRARVVAASDEARRRIERNLHDGVQQRLVSLGLQVRAAEDLADTPSDDLQTRLASIAEGLANAFDDLREIARGIHPGVLARGGLGPAVRTLARRSPVPVEVDVSAGWRLPQHLEVAAYYVVSEALTNAAKHAHATCVRVRAALEDGVLELEICDDGVGGAHPGRGSGLIGLTDRVEAVGGRIRIMSPPGAGTTVLATLPVEQPAPIAPGKDA